MTTALPLLPGPAWPGVRVFSTTRQGGVSRPPFHQLNLADHVGDAADAVAANRQRLQALLPAAPCWLQQVHGCRVHDADAAPGGPAVPVADAAVTCCPERVLAVLTADCLPVVLVDRRAGVLAVAHAGWRGLAGGVLEATLGSMRTRGASPDRVQAWIGPAIGAAAFEVGDDVRAAMGPQAAWAFVPRQGVPGKWWCNLPELAAWRLRQAGCAEVTGSGLCTVADPRWYSYRRDGQTGRFVTLAWLDRQPA